MQLKPTAVNRSIHSLETSHESASHRVHDDNRTNAKRTTPRLSAG